MEKNIVISGLSILDMYERNGLKFGFFIQSVTWGNTAARVNYIININEGEYPKDTKAIKDNLIMVTFYDKDSRTPICDGPITSPTDNKKYLMLKKGK